MITPALYSGVTVVLRCYTQSVIYKHVKKILLREGLCNYRSVLRKYPAVQQCPACV